MPEEALTLVATAVRYYSDHDETAFFDWLDRLDCVEGYRGVGLDLFIKLKRKPMRSDLQELIALFFRYGVDMRQLARFETKSNRKWMRNPDAFWHGLVYGSG